MSPIQKSCPVNGTNIFYTESGQGPGLVLIHGSLCDYRYWRWQYDAFTSEYQTISPSLRGCWPDDAIHPLAGYNTVQHAQDLISFLKQQYPGQRFNILGHSRGTQVAVQIVLDAPDLCNSLILADPSFRFTDEPTSKPFYADTVLLLKRDMVDEALEMFVDTVNGDETWRKMTPWFKEMATENAMTLLSQIEEHNFAFKPEQIAQIHSPVLLINGKNSPTKYQHRADRIQKLLPASQRVQIALAAHGMNLANPRSFNRAVLDFLASIN